jgi:hypothetical protein
MMIVMEAEEVTRVEANMVAIAVEKVAPPDKEDVDDFAAWMTSKRLYSCPSSPPKGMSMLIGSWSSDGRPYRASSPRGQPLQAATHLSREKARRQVPSVSVEARMSQHEKVDKFKRNMRSRQRWCAQDKA